MGTYSTLKDKHGYVVDMPTIDEDGIITDGNIFISVKPELLPSLQEQGIFDGYPVKFDVKNRNAINIRLTTNVGKAVAKECLDKKKHTRFGAKYMVKDSLLAFEGTMTTNAQFMECGPM